MENDKKMETVLRMVQKALNLAENNPNPEEAQTAMLKAQELMAKYNLTMSDFGGTEERQKNVDDSIVAGLSSQLNWWERHLGRIIAENFRCRNYLSTYKGEKVLRFIGLQEDVELAVQVFDFAVYNINYHSQLYILVNKIKGKSLIAQTKNDYILGYLNGLEEKFKEQVNKNGWGLVLVQDALVVQAVEDLNLRTAKAATFTLGGNAHARGQGYEEGKKFGYNKHNALKS